MLKKSNENIGAALNIVMLLGVRQSLVFTLLQTFNENIYVHAIATVKFFTGWQQ